jgi:transposase InsO family protein
MAGTDLTKAEFDDDELALAIRYTLAGGDRNLIAALPRAAQYRFITKYQGAQVDNGALLLPHPTYGEARLITVVPRSQIAAKIKGLYDISQFGRDKLWQTFINGKMLGISRVDVAKWLAANTTQQLHQQVPKKAQFVRSVTAQAPLVRWMIDTTELSSTPLQRRFLLVMIDVHSKKVWAKVIDKNKRAKNNAGLKGVSAADVVTFLRSVWRANFHPRVLNSDNGLEFKNEKVAALCAEFGVTQVFGSTYASRSQGQVERVNRTLKSMIFKRFTHLGNARFNNNTLQEIVTAYNTSWHRVIKKTPDSAAKPSIEAPNPKGVATVAGRLQAASHKLSEKYASTSRVINRGDHVRVALSALDRAKIKRDEKGFSKGYVKQWSDDLYVVKVKTRLKPRADAVNKSTVSYYLLRRVRDGEEPQIKFYRQQLLWVPSPAN